jgi:hypothetical protein
LPLVVLRSTPPTLLLNQFYFFVSFSFAVGALRNTKSGVLNLLVFVIYQAENKNSSLVPFFPILMARQFSINPFSYICPSYSTTFALSIII